VPKPPRVVEDELYGLSVLEVPLVLDDGEVLEVALLLVVEGNVLLVDFEAGTVLLVVFESGTELT
jgi:hypothetical protein